MKIILNTDLIDSEFMVKQYSNISTKLL